MNSKIQHEHSKVWQDLRYFLAFGFGSGLIPLAPGTFGTIAALPLYYLLCNLNAATYFVLCILGFMCGIKIIDYVSTNLEENDYPGIVWDEIIGFLLVMFLVPATVKNVCVGFILFRIFDIWKPLPIKWLDTRFKNGFGVMIDDVVAAIYAWLLLQIIIRIF